jgi:hypothetical protein
MLLVRSILHRLEAMLHYHMRPHSARAPKARMVPQEPAVGLLKDLFDKQFRHSTQ